MSNMKNGFSTLNRWLGKKNKDKSAPNGKLSKSSTNLSLSVSTANINETSQLEYNRITPLPAATSNAPFEQTFRITVLLPKEQLYVSRLGARVPLSKLLELVCENKLLDAEKYEFRNPVDPSQVYSCDLTIGAVGLSEIRLCHKSESYDTFNTEEVIKLHRTSIIRDSLSSSEFSSRNSKHTTKTASPYSSSNSLNSMDSTGMNYTRTPLSLPPSLPTSTPPKMTAPPRKKRTAPRPPSHTAIPEKSALVITNGDAELSMDSLKDVTLPRKDYFVSTPNLTSSTLLAGDIDCNGNTKVKHNHNEVTTNGNHIVDESQLYATVEKKNARNLYRGSVQNLSSDQAQKFPEPSPRKRLIQIKKKSAPAPPPRGSMYGDDSISIASTTASTPDTPLTPATPDIDEEPLSPPDIYANSTSFNASESSPKTREAPQPLAREFTPATKPLQSSTPVLSTETVESEEVAITTTTAETPPHMPKPVPRLTTTTLLNVNTEVDADPTKQDQPEPSQNINVSKVMLNRTPTPEPRSLSSEPPEMMDSSLAAHISELNNATSGEEDDNVSKQADSGIGEPIPSPIPDSLPSEGSAHECKSTFESSSDDDDMIKVYNFKLGKTLVKPMGEHKTLEDLTVIAAAQTDSGETTPSTLTREATPLVSETSSWNFSIPISPPANFADANEFKDKIDADKQPDMPITPKIKERPVLNFEALTKDNVSASNKPEDMVDRGVVNKEHKMVKEFTKVEKGQKIEQSRAAPLPSPSTPMNEIVEELSTFIQEKRMDTLIKKAEDQPKIESAKPNTLSNFSITASSQQTTKPSEILTNGVQVPPQTPESSGDEEKLYRKKGNTVNNLLKQRSSVTRSESFHTTALSTQSSPTVEVSSDQANGNGLNSRSSSYLSLTKLEQNGLNLNRRRSSSELSIGESPSLQSLEIIKTILNSRKNSLANSSDGECKPTEIVNFVEGKRTPTEESRPTKVVELKPKNKEVEVVVVTPVATIEKLEAPTKVEIEPIKAKEVPKVYRYSGPPSINFSTWNDRPKVQVSIKNEGDYIFGGTNAGSSNAAVTTAAVEMTVNSMPRNYRASTPAGTFKMESTPPPPAVAPKPGSPIKRMGIPEKEFRVPLTVKPLADVTVETVQLQKTQPPPPAPAANTQTKTSVTTVTLNANGSAQQTKDEINRRVESIVGRRPFSQNITNTSTLPRSGVAGNRFSTPAPAAGGPTLLRSTSIHQVEATKPKPTVQTEPSAAPFGQNTLRKTGFKEKMLARQEEEERKSKMSEPEVRPTSYTLKSTQNSAKTKSQNVVAPQITTATNGNVTITTSSNFKPQNSNTPITVSSTKTLQSAKLELKLQKSTSVFVNQSTCNASPPAVQTPKSAPVAPPPPPMMSFSKGKSPAVTPTAADPRDQLLAAIRNFKRDELNRN